MKLTLPMVPSLNRMYRTVQGRMLISAEGRAYKKTVGQLCLIQRVKPLLGEIALTVTVYRPAKRGDLDNYFKGLMDSLNGIAWMDDSQIVEIHAFRKDDKHDPRIEIEIWEQERKL